MRPPMRHIVQLLHKRKLLLHMAGSQMETAGMPEGYLRLEKDKCHLDFDKEANYVLLRDP